MTQASPARVERRRQHAEPPIEGRAFPMPPAGMLSEQENLIDFGLVLGLIHPEGSPILICAWDGKALKRMLPDEAVALAADLVLTPGMKPVIYALRALAKRAGDIAVASLMRTEGNA